MDGFDNSELPAPDLSDSFPDFHPDGLVLGGLDKPTLNAMADINSWADGTHPLGSLDVTGPAPASVQGPDIPPPDSAKGVEKAFDTTGTMVDVMHGIIGQAGSFLPGDKTVLAGLRGVTTAITTPLTIGGGIAGTFSDIHNGTSPGTAILGNAARTGLVLGAGALGEIGGPLGGAAAAYAANHYLPDSATIGRGLVNSITTPPDPSIYFPM